MPRLSFKDKFDLYVSDDNETSPGWVLVGEGVNVRVTQLSAGAVVAEAAAYDMVVTHRGHCQYNSSIQERPDATLLVDVTSGDQYQVLRVSKGEAPRGGNADLTLHLYKRVPKYVNLRKT